MRAANQVAEGDVAVQLAAASRDETGQLLEHSMPLEAYLPELTPRATAVIEVVGKSSVPLKWKIQLGVLP